MSKNDFFAERKEQSRIKIEIVNKYFAAWWKILLPSVESRGEKLGYIDLFSGPGLYKDGNKSTPILLLEYAITQPKLRKRLVTIFNDINNKHIISLRKHIDNISEIDLLENKPILRNDCVCDNLVNKLENISFIPSLIFIDPCGYKGLSLSLLNSVLKGWGCDCIFFFNYNRINMILNNPRQHDHIDDIYGKERANKLKETINRLKPKEHELRELNIINELCQAIKDRNFPFVFHFRFKNEFPQRTSHYLIFISKNVRGYEIMKSIMAKYSSEFHQGVPTYEYNPLAKKQPSLTSFKRPLDDLSKMLVTEFSGRSLRMIDIYNNHHVDKAYISKNYKDILLIMEKNGLIQTDPPISQRPIRTFANNVIVTFPEKQ